MRITLFLLLLVSYSSRGQVIMSLLLGDKLNSGKIEFGLDGGVNFSSIRGLSGGEMRGTFNIGFYFDIKVKSPAWLVHTGVLVKSTLGESNLPVYALSDPNLDNVSKARAALTNEQRRRVRFAVHDAEALDLPRERFDVALCGWSL